MKRWYVSLPLVLMVFLTGCSAGRSAYNRGESLQQEGRLDEAVQRYADAMKADPTTYEYKARFLAAKFQASQQHFKNGEELFAAKEYNEAVREYQLAIALDPSFDRAQKRSELAEHLRDSQAALAEGKGLEETKKPKEAIVAYRKAVSLNPENKEAAAALDRLTQGKRPRLEGYELNLKSTKPITLKFKDAKVRDVFTIITRLSGINFVFDDTVKEQTVTISLENATFLQCLEILCGTNKLGRKVLNENTIIIYPKTPEKAKQYDEVMVQTFYLTNLDAKKAVNLLRTMLQVKKVYVNEDLNALVVRDTPEVLEVVQKILEANDLQEAEVVLDVEVIELVGNLDETFGLALSSYNVTAGLARNGIPISDSYTKAADFTPKAADVDKLLPWKWGNASGFYSIPYATFNFGKTVANAEILSNPKVRVKNREKSKFNVGERIPITTSTNVNAATSVNVQYVDVGIKVSAEPTIQRNNEVSLKLSLEVSAAGQPRTVDNFGTQVVDISTRNLDSVLTIKDGDTSLIGGLISIRKGYSKNGISFLSDLPIIGYLFSSKNTQEKKNELILAITPRIVRTVPYTSPEASSFWSGKEDEPSVRKPFSSFQQSDESAMAPAAAPGAPAPGAPAPVAGIAPAAAVTPTAPGAVPTVNIAPAPPVVPDGAQPAPAKPATPSTIVIPPPPEAPKRVTLALAGPATVGTGDQLTVDIIANDAKGLATAPFVLAYDPIFADFVSATAGDFLGKGGEVNFSSTVDPTSGIVRINLQRAAGSGVDGSGVLARITFKAKNAGPLGIALQEARFTTADRKPVDVLPGSMTIEVK